MHCYHAFVSVMVNWHSERLHHSKHLATVVLMEISHEKIILDCNLCLQALLDMLLPLMPRQGLQLKQSLE